MSSRRRWTTACRLALGVAVSLGAGCGAARSTLKLTSHRDPYFPERYVVEWTDCAYWSDPSGDVHVVGRAEPAADEEDTLTQYVHVHVYWKPFPGRTHTDSSATNALVEYVVTSNAGAARYTGTCFAYLRGKPGRTLKVAVESGRLRLDTYTGRISDFLGATHVAGTLMARADEVAATDLIRTMQRAAAAE